MKVYNDIFKITKLTKELTERGSNCFNIEAVNTQTGEIVNCTYFGNTTPKRIISIRESGNYKIAEIQPHTSRDRKTGKFKCSRKAFS